MAILLVIDLQREFVKDQVGLEVYKRCVQYINTCGHLYSQILAPIYRNGELRNMHMLTHWDEMQEIKKLDFKPNKLYLHSGYSAISDMKIPANTQVDVIGFDTDACVLSHCFDLFNHDIPFKVLVDGCWSSGGAEMHEAGLKCMQRQFNRAVDTVSKLEDICVAQSKVTESMKR